MTTLSPGEKIFLFRLTTSRIRRLVRFRLTAPLIFPARRNANLACSLDSLEPVILKLRKSPRYTLPEENTPSISFFLLILSLLERESSFIPHLPLGTCTVRRLRLLARRLFRILLPAFVDILFLKPWSLSLLRLEG